MIRPSSRSDSCRRVSKLVAGLGRGIGPAERDDEATDLGDHRDQAGGQREQGGGEVRCQQESAST